MIRSIEIYHEDIIEPIHVPIEDVDEFIIHELPNEVNEIDVVDHEEIIVETKPLDSPIEETKETNVPLENEVPVLFHLEEQPQTQALQESKPISTTIKVDEEIEIPKVKKYNLEDYIEPIDNEKEIQMTVDSVEKNEV